MRPASRDYDYDSLLSSSLDVMSECSSIDSLLKDHGSSFNKHSTVEISNSLDNAILALVKNYAKNLDARLKALSAVIVSLDAQGDCRSRQDAAEDLGNDINGIKKVYSSRTHQKSTRGRQSSEIEKLISEFRSFCETLLRQRNGEGQTVSKQLCYIYLENYRKQEGNEDDIGVSDSITLPLCILSNEILQSPVVGPCGHFFSQDVITASIEQSAQSKIECPSFGCRQTLSKTNLERDYFKDIEVSLWLKSEKRRRQEDSINITHV